MDYRYAGSLLREIARLHGQAQRETLACCGPTNASECTVLTELGRSQSPLTVADLARRLDVDKGWVSRVAEGLYQQGLVEKAQGTIDRRTVYISLTEQGKERHAQLDRALNEHSASLLSRIPADKHETVLEVLEMLKTALSGESCCGVKLVQLEENP
jgi:DNA-binding MarR family transcriptional regulator